MIQGDIAQQSADALVDAAGTSRRTGVAGALRRVGGEALDAAAVASGPVELGALTGFEPAEGTRIVAAESSEFTPETLSDVRFIAYSDSAYRTASRVADEVRGGEE